MRKLLVLASLVGLAGSLSAAALQASSAPSFTAAQSYPTGKGPQSVAIGDLNGDGSPDLATANAFARTLSVLVNRGDGTFRTRVDYRTGGGASVAIGDLNGDGKPDLAASTGSNTVSVLLNRGDGTFQARLDYRTGRLPAAVAIGDLNGDGRLDLATVSVLDGTVSVLLNRGDGTFQAKRDYRTGPSPGSLAIGDLNGDGKRDLATATGEFIGASSVSVLLNRGDGSFRARRDHPIGHDVEVSVAIGDLNDDGRPDLATANSGVMDTVSVFLNRGGGRFRARRDYGTGHGGPGEVAIGDLNGDGKSELATANSEGTVSVLANRGDGSFQAKLDYRTGKISRSVAIEDLNGDGRRDLAIANRDSNTVSVLTNTPGLCTVQDVEGKTLSAAKRTIARANCRVAKIGRAYSRNFTKGRVISQKPKPGTVLPNRGKVNLVVSRGRRPS